jgi:hypothetical protein
MASMVSFFSALLAYVIWPAVVTREIDVFVMRSATMFKGRPKERVEFMLSCEHIPRFLLSGHPKVTPLIRYDISGVDPGRVQEIIEADWYHLLQEKRVLNSPNYLREDGKPVIAIWGAQTSQYCCGSLAQSCRSFKVSDSMTANTHPTKCAR